MKKFAGIRAYFNLKTTPKTKYYLLILIVTIFYVLCYLVGFDPSEIKDYNFSIAYPVFILFILMVFFILFAIWRIFLSENFIDETHQDIDLINSKKRINEAILVIENKISKRLTKLNFRMKTTSLMGNILLISGFIIPFITWIYTLRIYDKTEKIPNIWSMVFSSTSVGTITLTIGITLIRHSKTIQQEITYFEEKLIHFMSIRSASNVATSYLLGNAAKIEFLIYKSLLNYVDHSDSKEEDIDKDETSNISRAAQLSSAIARAKIHDN